MALLIKLFVKLRTIMKNWESINTSWLRQILYSQERRPKISLLRTRRLQILDERRISCCVWFNYEADGRYSMASIDALSDDF